MQAINRPKPRRRYHYTHVVRDVPPNRDELDKSGKPILLGVRPNGAEVFVDGMSDGTRDQLYLSLRLATLEQHLGKGEPMPFVVDDILIGFDDHRTSGSASRSSRSWRSGPRFYFSLTTGGSLSCQECSKRRQEFLRLSCIEDTIVPYLN